MFEWDSRKAAANLAKHGVPFEFAARVFDDPRRLEFDASRPHEGEMRRKCVGMIDGKLYVVVFTVRARILTQAVELVGRGLNRRIISARRTNAKEDRAYADGTQDE
jgi:uncharacterized DUF497 family protein